MQPIQDKDFDKLFKNAFEDAEVTPSRDLWSSIESEIEPKKKRIIPIYWLSAAAILLIASVGFLIYQQQSTVNPNKNLAQNRTETVKPVLKANTPNDSVKAVPTVEKKIENTLPMVTKPAFSVAKTNKTKAEPVEKTRIVTAPEMQKQETTIAKVELPKQEIIKKKIEEAIQQPKEVIAMVETPVTDVINENDQSNKGIRNVGDVVNLIVNKVDKRKDKFIQFRTDDDDSSLSSINIGPFKIGKKNRK